MEPQNDDGGRSAARCAMALALAGTAVLTACDTNDGGVSPQQAADQAYTYALPVYEMAATRAKAYAMGQPPNTFIHLRSLTTAQSRAVTTPNHDTLYSSAWLDLRGGPLQLTIPATGSRYFSLALLDFYSNDFAVLGTRRDGGVAKTFWIAGPGWQGVPPPGVELIAAPTDAVWALGRTFVADDADLAAAHAVQDGLQLAPTPSTATLPLPASALRATPALTDWTDFFAAVDAVLTENPPPPQDRAFLFYGPRTIGVDAGLRYDAARFPASTQAAIAAGAQAAYDRARTPPAGKAVQGWLYPQRDLGVYGSDYAYRAATALSGLGALPNAEAEYFFGAGDIAPARYDGTHEYRLHFPPGQRPPAGAFWSLTLYEAEDDGSFFFYDNPLNRYAVGSASPGLSADSDGGLSLYIGVANPAPGLPANWLPAPAGPFEVVLRIYLPQAAVLDGSYRLPPLARLDQ